MEELRLQSPGLQSRLAAAIDILCAKIAGARSLEKRNFVLVHSHELRKGGQLILIKEGNGLYADGFGGETSEKQKRSAFRD